MTGLGADIYQKGYQAGESNGEVRGEARGIKKGREEKDREYQSQIEALKAENERLKALLD